MTVFFWVTDLLTPMVMVLIGVLFLKRPPKSINVLYGYRTPRSMKSKAAWDVAHAVFGGLCLRAGLVLMPLVAAAKLLLPVPPEYLSLADVGVELLALVLLIPLTERKLKKIFG